MMVKDAPEDPGWLIAEINGKRGLAPGTHVARTKQ
jgi:hypothetical protein